MAAAPQTAKTIRVLPSLNGFAKSFFGLDNLTESPKLSGQKLTVARALRNRIEQVDAAIYGEDSFFVADLNRVRQQYLNFRLNLPRVTPHYAVKCNSDKRVLELLAELGANFDCASKNEIDTILGLGVDASRIIYANPCKSPSHINHAKKNNVSLMTFDNSEELRKCARIFPGAKLLMRLITDDSAATCQLSTKFGCTKSEVPELLDLAQSLGLNIVGVAFHVGSGSNDPNAFATALKDSRDVIDQGRKVGFDMSILDIGGGFESKSFRSTSKLLNKSLDKYFNAEQEPNLRIIAEPGRLFVAEAFTLATHVIALRRVSNRKARIYLNDGVYGNLNSILFDHQTPDPKLLKTRHGFHYEMLDSNDFTRPAFVEASIWGPTCDGLDCISKSTNLFTMPEIGDWMYFENTGAYTKAAATQFNGFNTNCDVLYVDSEV